MTRGFGTEFERLRAKQAGVLTLASAVGCVGRPAVRSRLASGRWRLVAVRVLVTQSGPLTDQQRLWVSVLAAGEGAALAGLTAARLGGLTGFGDRRVHVLIPGSRRLRHSPPGALVHRSRLLEAADVHPTLLPPRTRPFRLSYADVMADVLDRVLTLAGRALRAGVDPARIVIDAAHDFGKNTWHSLELTRRLGEMTATGWPVLLSASRKDFVGETLGADIEDRLPGTLAVTAVGAWLGARVFRAHDVRQTRQALDMVAAVKGDLPPSRAVRGLA